MGNLNKVSALAIGVALGLNVAHAHAAGATLNFVI